MTRRRYTLEFKKEAVKLVTERGYSRIQAAKILGISPKNINNWITKAKKGKSACMAKSSVNEEIKRLRKENERLRMEREILKKAAAFFANEKP